MDWLSKILQDNKQVYAPVAKGNKTDFKHIRSANEISMDHIQTTQSAKGIAFPRTEKLFSYTKEKGDVTLQNYDADAIPETIVFGIHPCDAAGFKPLSGILNWDTKDLPFNERMSRTTLIGVSCTQCDEYCF